jgi:signal transduction histidine kinase
VAEVDLKGCVYYANSALEKLFPEFSQQCSRHEWLSNWESIASSFRSGKRESAVREVSCGGRWYYQSFIWIDAAQRVRVYALDTTGRRQAEDALKTSHDALETWVHERTRQLQLANQRLQSEVAERQRTEQLLIKHQAQLRKLSSALVQTEERERRRISIAIHDGIGQTLWPPRKSNWIPP